MGGGVGGGEWEGECSGGECERGCYGYPFLLIGASLSEPHTSVTSLHLCVRMFACMLGPTTYRKSLPALTLRGYVIR